MDGYGPAEETQSERVVVQLPGWREGIQREPDTLERRGSANPMQFSKLKCKVLFRSNARHTYHVSSGGEVIENSPVKRDWGVMVDKKLNISRLNLSWVASKGVWPACHGGGDSPSLLS